MLLCTCISMYIQYMNMHVAFSMYICTCIIPFGYTSAVLTLLHIPPHTHRPVAIALYDYDALGEEGNLNFDEGEVIEVRIITTLRRPHTRTCTSIQ